LAGVRVVGEYVLVYARTGYEPRCRTDTGRAGRIQID